MCGYFVLCLNCPIVAVFLMRRMDRAAPQSTKAKVAPFHNFILERGGALKLCLGEAKRTDMFKQSHFQTCKPSPQHVTLKRWIQCKNCYLPRHRSSLTFPWIHFSQRGFHFYRQFTFLWLCCQLIFTWSEFAIHELHITCWHLRMQCVFNHCCLREKKNTAAISYLHWR